MNSYYLYLLYLQDVARRKKERNSEHHTVSETAKSFSSFLLPNKQPVDHVDIVDVLNGLAVGRTAYPAGDQTGLADSMDFWTRESNRGRFSS